MASKMSLEETRRQQNERKRNMLYLIAQYLSDFGFNASHDTFFKEANLTANYRLKFERSPKIIKNVEDGNVGGRAKFSARQTKRQITSELNLASKEHLPEALVTNSDSLNSVIVVSSAGKNKDDESGDSGRKFGMLRTLGDFLCHHPDHREMAEILHREIVHRDSGIKWADVQGNTATKQLLYDTVIMPLKYPGLFKGVIRPWRGILLHGPSGTGKTLMAKALCAETHGQVTFFNVAASTITSKWRGDSEKFIKVLFEMAKYFAPSVIFIDEIEGLTSKRDSLGEHEASRRFKNEFLIEIDGLDYDDANVLLLVNSNLPWEIDLAFLRRFERRILVDLPDATDRMNIIQHYLPEARAYGADMKEDVAKACENFTGAEIKIACKEASLKQIRQIIENKSNAISTPNAITVDNLKSTFTAVSPSMVAMSKRHREWNKNHGHNG